MKGQPTTLHDFEPETPAEVVARIQADACDAVAEQGVTLDV